MNVAKKNESMTTHDTNDCAAFQEQLPELFESGADLKQQQHLKTCEQCSALVSDLEYIAQQAKLLLPIHDPSPAVWENIQTSLTSEKQNSRTSR
jgi:4-hydroxy-3-methylbut-2-en-1-yl diphosphate synthase IspG/GcpE